jgi:hypothetical protein
MTAESLAAQIKGLEAQLSMLKAQVRSLGTLMQAKTLGDLHGLLAGRADSTEADIDAVLYHSAWGDEEPGTTL